MSLWSRVANVFRGDRLKREIEEEFESHITEAIEQGRDPVEVRRALGPVLRQREKSHEVKVIAWLDALRADIIFGFRQLKRNKVTSAAAILSLALAIGACTSAFRLIDALLLRPLPVAHPEQLYVLSRQGLGFDGRFGSFDSWAYPAFAQMRAAAKGQAELIAISYAGRTDVTYTSNLETEKANVLYVSGWMFPTFAIQPAVGRLLTEKDDLKPGASPQAVLSYDYWTRRFGGDPRVVGRTFHLGDGIYEIIGVSENKFTGTEPGTIVDIFLPTMMNRHVGRSDSTWIRTLAVVRPGVAVEPIREKLAAISHAFEANRLSGETGLSQETLQNVLNNQFLMEAAPAGVSEMQKDYSRALIALGILLLMVLFIACANVANLMTARAVARAREMALRVSIGAGHWRLVQMVLAESALLGCLAAASGAIFAWWSAPFVVSMINPPDNPARLVLPADWRMLAFGAVLTLGGVFLFGLLPALRASSVKPVSVLKGGDDPHARRRMMQSMIVLQVAFCFLVLFVAGLFATTFQRLSTAPTGFSADRLLLLETTSLPPQPAVYWDQAADRLRDVPGVERVAQSGQALLQGDAWNDSISVNGGPPSTDLAYFLSISPGWLDTMKIQLIEGQDFRESDAYPDVAIVNQTFARKFLNDPNPIGKSFEKASDGGTRDRMQIVAVVHDADYRSLKEPMLPVVFVPLHAHNSHGALLPLSAATFVVRTSGQEPVALASTLRQQVAGLRSAFHVTNVRTQEEVNQAQTVRERLMATLAFFFGAVALLLAAIGLYGVMNYSLLQREREIGIRLALGAKAGSIAAQVTGGIFFAVLVGSAAGLTLGVVSVRAIESLLYQAKATDVFVLALPSLTIFAAVFIAAIPTVVKALNIDPVAMLRAE